MSLRMPIKTPTVLVLGAGASSYYGFPTGEKLLLEIQEDCLDKSSHLRKFCPNSFAAEFVYFIKQTPTLTIDELLERHPRFAKIGKIAIAARLLPCESQENVFATAKRHDCWYRLLWKSIETPSFDDLIHLNNLSILTFNYDRSLDHYLRVAMKNVYRKDTEEVESIMSQIDMIHVHGQLGSLDDIVYGTDIKKLSDEKFQMVADGIKTTQDADQNLNAFLRAKRCLKAAKRIIFLGYGFHKANSDRLLCQECYDTAKYGTAFKLSEAQMTDAVSQVHGCDLKNMTVSDFLRETCLLEK